jgi:hypothetical protein
VQTKPVAGNPVTPKSDEAQRLDAILAGNKQRMEQMIAGIRATFTTPAPAVAPPPAAPTKSRKPLSEEVLAKLREAGKRGAAAKAAKKAAAQAA